MANKSPEGDQLAQTIEGLNALKEERIKALAGDMKDIRESIRHLTGADSIDLKEPIDFLTIIKWSSGGSGVMRFLGDDYNSRTVVRIESLVGPDATEPPTEILIVSPDSAAGLLPQRLEVTVGNSVKLLAVSERDLGHTAKMGIEEINSCLGQDPVSTFHRIDLAQDAVQFARQALLQEVTAIDTRVRGQK